MSYYVLDPSGAQYGPADMAMLQQWHREGRILASTSIRDAVTGQTLPASAIPGLMSNTYGGGPAYAPPSSPYGSAPYSAPPPPGGFSPYPRIGPAGIARNDVTIAWIMAGTGIVLSLCLCPMASIGLGVGGWYFARKAQMQGDINATAPMVASYFSIGLGATFTILGFVLRGMLRFY